MTFRFTYKASDAATRLCEIQKKLSLARKRVSELEQEERNLRAFLVPYFDPNEKIDLEFPDGSVLRVSCSQYEMFTLDQDAVKNVFAKLRKRVPYNKTVINKMMIKKRVG